MSEAGTESSLSRSCPIACLAPLLSRPTFQVLAAGLDDSAIVGDVVELYERRRLMKLPNISTGRAGEVRQCLVEAGLVEGDGRLVIRRRHTPADARFYCQCTSLHG